MVENVIALENSLAQLSDVIADYRALAEERDSLQEEIHILRRKADQLEVITLHVSSLEEKLADARSTKKTLQKIETLEYTVETLSNNLRDRDAKIYELSQLQAQNSRMISDAQKIHDRVKYLALKLGIKEGNRSTTSLLAAVEDAIRKSR